MRNIIAINKAKLYKENPSGPPEWVLCLLHTIDSLNDSNNYDGKAAEQADTQLILQVKLVAIETCSSSMLLLCLESTYSEEVVSKLL